MRKDKASIKWAKCTITPEQQKELQDFCKEHHISQSDLIRNSVWAAMAAAEEKENDER